MNLKEAKVWGKSAGFRTGRSGIKPQRETLVLIHGSGGSSLSWLPQLSGLDQYMNVVALDLPGHGSTPGQPLDRVEDYASWVQEFIKTADLAPCFVAGHSLGGAIVQRMALDHPQLFKGIVLVGTGARLRVTPKILEGIHQDYESTVEFIIRSCYSKQAPPELIRQGVELAKEVTPQQLHANFAACDRFDIMDQVERINLPTLIIVGQEDIMTPVKYSQYLNQKISGSRLVILDKAGHGVMHEAPEAFNQAVREFVTGSS